MKQKKEGIYEDIVRREVKDYWSILLLSAIFFILLFFGLAIIELNGSGINPQPMMVLMIVLLITCILVNILAKLKQGEAVISRLQAAFNLFCAGVSISFIGLWLIKYIPLIQALLFALIPLILLILGFFYSYLKFEKTRLLKFIENKAWDDERGVFDPIAARKGRMMGPEIIAAGSIGGLMGLIGMKLAQVMSPSYGAILLVILMIGVSSMMMFFTGSEFYFVKWLLSWERKHHKKVYLKGFEPEDRKERNENKK